MTVELEDKPQVGTIEALDTSSIEDIEEMRCHAYHPLLHFGKAMCGLPQEQDPHAQMHIRENLGCYYYKPGDKSCGYCGAPLCEICEAELHKFHHPV